MEVVEYNGYLYITEKETWKEIRYKDVKPDMYEVSDLGRFRRKKTKVILYGNNVKNEKGYCRICLCSKSGKMKKYQMHRIVLFTFADLDDSHEVNHKNGIKKMNALFNLEKSTRKENAEHASIKDLYSSCERHYKSIFTNNEVEEICKRASEGESISAIIHNMKLEGRGSVYSNIDKILSGKTWKKISKKYNLDYNMYHYKTYSHDDLLKLCYYIFSTDMKPKEIVKLFPNYDCEKLKVVIKSIKSGKCYKKVINEYESSTTIENIG